MISPANGVAVKGLPPAPAQPASLRVAFHAKTLQREIGVQVFGHCEPDRANAPLLLYFHGGRFDTGRVEDAYGFAAAVAAQMVVMVVDYPLAPAAVFPQTVDVAFEALQWAHAHAGKFGANARDIIVGGDEAGGNLAAALAMMARDGVVAGSRFSLGGQILISPMLDPHQTSASMHARDGCSCRRGWAAYLKTAGDALHPYAAPLQSRRLAGLAPALIITAEKDVLRDEAEQYAAALIAAGVPVQVRRFHGVGGDLAQAQHPRFASLVSTVTQFINDPA
ncbi:MAG TPA: alpha/beta hydrolase fold domain-containing protein [Oxalicibacterium sp.]|jgi:acetyl esterase|nr:alpha/beta hydrolase fold domain-containing protein [Oxalicibacterium sp.]